MRQDRIAAAAKNRLVVFAKFSSADVHARLTRSFGARPSLPKNGNSGLAQLFAALTLVPNTQDRPLYVTTSVAIAGICARRLGLITTDMVGGSVAEWLAVLDSGAEGSGFTSQPRRCRVTDLGKLFTPIVPLFTEQRNW